MFSIFWILKIVESCKISVFGAVREESEDESFGRTDENPRKWFFLFPFERWNRLIVDNCSGSHELFSVENWTCVVELLRIGRGATYPQQSIFRLVNVLFRIGVWHHHRDSFEWLRCTRTRNTGMPQRYWVWILVCLQTHHTHTDTHAHERTRPCSTVRRKSRFSVGHFRLPRLLFDCKLTPGSVWTTTRYASAPTIRRDSPTRLGKRTYI